MVTYGRISVEPLIGVLGIIGTNQYLSVPNKAFCKDNYPLPRDIAARTLARIGGVALPKLLKVLERGEQKQCNEAIDSIGWICFYEAQGLTYESLHSYWFDHQKIDLICWKLMRAMSSFPESEAFLIEQKQICRNERIVQEMDRSLRLLQKRKN